MTPPPRQEGYTLTEMLVVIGIIGLIAAVITPALIGQMGRARAKTAALQLDNTAAAVELFMTDVGRYPTTMEGLSVLVVEPAGVEGWTGPYLKDDRSLNDPWGGKLIYQSGDGHSYSITSLGSDGAKGGKGARRDLVVHTGQGLSTTQ